VGCACAMDLPGKVDLSCEGPQHQGGQEVGCACAMDSPGPMAEKSIRVGD
jgi:hypothetical protein